MTMSREAFLGWLTGWMSRHPLRTPHASRSSAYTQHVMARVRALSQSAQPAFLGTLASLLAWMRQPRQALALSAAVVLLMSLALARPHRGLRVVAEVDEDVRWIEETLDLLDDVEEVPEDPTDDSQAAEDVWQELQELDEAEWSLGNA